MRAFFLACLMAVAWQSSLGAAPPDQKVLILYNHGTDIHDNCRRIALEYAELPKWARIIDGTDIIDHNGQPYEIEVEFVCTNEDPGSFDSDAAACDLGVCKRAGDIAKVVNERAKKYPRRQIFLAGHSAGAWASFLIKRHTPQSVNGLILTAPAFGGKRDHRTCLEPSCGVDEAPALRRMKIRAHHENHLTDNPGKSSLDALIAGFPCDDFGWPSELPLGPKSGAELHIFPPVEVRGDPLVCGQRAADRHFNGQPRRFYQKVHNRDRPGEPVCSEKRIAYCPEKFRELCEEKCHRFYDDFKKKFPWVLRPPVFADWFVGEGIVQIFIKERLANWSYNDGQSIEGQVCGFMADLSMCR